MNYGAIKWYDIANGPGVRISLFVSGCRNHCKGCFQPETWDFNYGNLYTEDVQCEILSRLSNPNIQGITVLGGDPFERENQEDVCDLVFRVKQHYGSSKDIWCYTGYTYDTDLQPGGKVFTQWTETILNNIDCLVDGPFILEQKDITLTFRGSRNQRIIPLNGYELPHSMMKRFK